MGSFIYWLLIVFEALLSTLLIGVIFMQKTKGGMGGTAFGGGAGEAIFGSRMGNVLTKATVVLGSIFLINTILLTVLTARRGPVASVMDKLPVAAPMAAPAAAPAAPAGDMTIPPAMPEMPAIAMPEPALAAEAATPVEPGPVVPPSE